MTILTIDWTEVGAVATAAAVVVGLAAVVLLVLLTRASRAAAAAAARLAGTGNELVERGHELVELATRYARLGETRTSVAQEQLLAVQEQVEIGELALATTRWPLLVPTKLGGPGFAGEDGPLQAVLPDGVYFAPLEQSVGAWTFEPAERKLVVACVFLNVGIGPAVLHPFHRIDVVRRGSVQPLVSFGGFAGGVVAVNARALAAFPLTPAEPSYGPALALLDRPDDEIQLMATIYYRSATSNRPLWTRVRYQRHLRTSPAGLLSQVSLELAMPDGTAP